jgi:hypothetical protein
MAHTHFKKQKTKCKVVEDRVELVYTNKMGDGPHPLLNETIMVVVSMASNIIS